MIAKRDLPKQFREWNAKWGAPYGRRLGCAKRLRKGLLGGRHLPIWIEARWRGPFGWQTNNSIRIFEYPWAYHVIRRQGSTLRVLEVGGGLSGLQFVLAAEGHRGVNVEPGQDALGWKYESDLHKRLCRAFSAPVELFSKKIDSLDAPPHSFDVILSVSALEHFSDADLAALAQGIKRLLKPEGIVVMTIDLFLDLKPFSELGGNEWGRNLDVREFLSTAGLRLGDGNQAELLGFPEFNASRIMGCLATYLVGDCYPALSQCVVARHNHRDRDVMGDRKVSCQRVQDREPGWNRQGISLREVHPSVVQGGFREV